MDIATGLLRADSGARAEERVSWKKGPRFAEDGIDMESVEGLGERMGDLPLVHDWMGARSGVATDFLRLGKDGRKR